ALNPVKARVNSRKIGFIWGDWAVYVHGRCGPFGFWWLDLRFTPPVNILSPAPPA
ncbi:MAG: hypothetical protein ACI9K9_001647, partial [Neolewinella sp.]